MKLFSHYALLLLGVLSLSACGGSGVSSTIYPKAFENIEELRKIHSAILESMGDQSSKVDEVTFNIDNPADKGNSGDAYLYIMADMQDPGNPKQLLRQQFHGELGYWMAPQEVTVTVHGSDEEKASFRLEESLFDFAALVSPETLHKVVMAAFAEGNTEPDEFTYRYVQYVGIDAEGYNVTVKGKLASNDQIIDDSYDFDFEGNIIP
ncbi:MAG: hypothetical protein LBU97_01310 [Alistipes sp.]|jgi:hypothetical protein|nr:hypothetical protein [Alistipes sp.]